MYNADYFIVRHLGRFIQETLRSLVRPGARVVDVGCGEQPMRALVESLGGRYWGVDVAHNRTRTVHALATASQLPFAPSSFDVVLCTEVLEHVSNHRTALAELVRILAPDGSIVLTVPFLYPLHEEPHDHVRITPHQMGTVAREHGLEVVKLDALGNELEVIATMWCRIWMPPEHRPGWRRRTRAIVNAILRTAGNGAALLGSRLAGNRLPRRAYLSTVAVLRRISAP